MRTKQVAIPVAAVLILIRMGMCATLDSTKRVTQHQTNSPVRHFVEVAFDRFPKSVISRDFCDDPGEASECWRDLRSSARVWAGDVNGDHIDELILFPGWQATGSGGRSYYLYQRHGRIWQSIVMAGDTAGAMDGDPDGWFTDRPRFEILPITRSGYRDLRIAVNDCLKWSNGKYVDYDPADYAALVPAWFDDADPHQAEIFWAIGHPGTESSRFEPQWFPMSPAFFLEQPQTSPNRRQEQAMLKEWQNDGGFPRLVRAAVDDAARHIRWVSLQRAGVWGIHGDRAFLLVPRPSYLGVCTLTIKGDWLLGYETCLLEDEPSEPEIRYNLRTHELQITTPEDWE